MRGRRETVPMLMSRALLVAGVAAALAAGPAQAGKRVIVKDHFYEELDEQSCNGTTYICALVSGRLPDDKVLKITQVSCYLESTAPLSNVALSEAREPLGLNLQMLRFLPATTTFSNNRYFHTFTQTVDLVARPGRYVRLIAGAYTPSEFFNGSCQITGTLSPQ